MIRGWESTDLCDHRVDSLLHGAIGVHERCRRRRQIPVGVGVRDEGLPIQFASTNFKHLFGTQGGWLSVLHQEVLLLVCLIREKA